MNTNLLEETYQQIDETMEPDRVNSIVTVWSLLVLVVLAFAYWLIWGFGNISSLFFIKVGLSSVGFIFVHELLHAFGYMLFGNASRKDIKFGVIWSQLMPYAHCKVPMKLKGYRIAVLLPLIVLGVFPTIYAFMTGSGYWAAIGIFMILGALGDVLIYWITRKYSGEEYVQDHPEKIGCIVYTPKGEQQ
ncbi:DUF3267 domain-containing protein [Anaerobacillus alkaliphilus]|uniref:DUF3267 domain-containing protein n=1 Tax=Anaerobacillus alkaliphilus TaxID=1548597 RepID=A0A4Q0VWY9_9BACI|nr:DUF3267 domain-containing protein [Anaerobacillus alkaliphilus]RXJ04243.1 DUF3267 domain-containing protein [Anaerobacillus alkaliphilus]